MADAPSMLSERRQVVNLPPVAAPVIIEYQLLSKTCICCGTVSTADWASADDVKTAVVAPPGGWCGSGPAPWLCARC